MTNVYVIVSGEPHDSGECVEEVCETKEDAIKMIELLILHTETGDWTERFTREGYLIKNEEGYYYRAFKQDVKKGLV